MRVDTTRSIAEHCAVAKKKQKKKRALRASVTGAVAATRPTAVRATRPAKKAKTKKVAKKKAAKRKPSKKKRAAKKTAKKKTAKKKTAKKRTAEKRTAKKTLARVRSLADRAERAADENAKEARRILAEIRRLLKRIEEDFHEIGRLLRLLQQERLHSAIGYPSFRALLKGEKLMGKTLAYQLVAVAEAYDAPQARRLGVSKAHRLLTSSKHARRRRRADAGGVERAHRRRTVEDISVRELEEATRRVRATGRASEMPEAERDARKAAREVQKRLRAKGAKSAKARAEPSGGEWAVVVRVHVEESGRRRQLTRRRSILGDPPGWVSPGWVSPTWVNPKSVRLETSETPTCRAARCGPVGGSAAGALRRRAQRTAMERRGPGNRPRPYASLPLRRRRPPPRTENRVPVRTPESGSRRRRNPPPRS